MTVANDLLASLDKRLGLLERDSSVLASLDKRLALLEQGSTLGEKAAFARDVALTKSIELLATDVRLALGATGEPTSSPAGRSLLSSIAASRTILEEHDLRIAAVERIRDEMSGALKGIRVMVTIMSGVSVGLSILAVLRL